MLCCSLTEAIINMSSILSHHNMLIWLSEAHNHGLKRSLARAQSNRFEAGPSWAKLQAGKTLTWSWVLHTCKHTKHAKKKQKGMERKERTSWGIRGEGENKNEERGEEAGSSSQGEEERKDGEKRGKGSVFSQATLQPAPQHSPSEYHSATHTCCTSHTHTAQRSPRPQCCSTELQNQAYKGK